MRGHLCAGHRMPATTAVTDDGELVLPSLRLGARTLSVRALRGAEILGFALLFVLLL